MSNKIGGGWFFILIIPIGMVIAFFLYDKGQRTYFEKNLQHDTKVIFTDMMNIEGLETNDEKIDFIEKEFERAGYSKGLVDVSLVYNDDYTYIFTSRKYISIVGSLSFGLITSKNKIVQASNKGHYNEYKEAIIEDFDPEVEEDL